MQHIDYFSSRGLSRLAREAGIGKATLSRLLAGLNEPHFSTVASVVTALEARLGRSIDPREVVRNDLDFPRTPCEICGCRGCLPAEFFTAADELRPEFRDVAPGTWTTAMLEAAREGGRHA